MEFSSSTLFNICFLHFLCPCLAPLGNRDSRKEKKETSCHYLYDAKGNRITTFTFVETTFRSTLGRFSSFGPVKVRRPHQLLVSSVSWLTSLPKFPPRRVRWGPSFRPAHPPTPPPRPPPPTKKIKKTKWRGGVKSEEGAVTIGKHVATST